MRSLPFESKFDSDPQGDRAVDDTTVRNIVKSVWSNGVCLISGDGSDLQVQPAGGMKVKIMPGGCIIEGGIGSEDTARTISISGAHASLKRIDRIVARLDTSDDFRNIELYKKEGTPSTTPVAPTLIHESNYYEIALADVHINAGASEISTANILDQRPNGELCGFVAPAFPVNFSLEAMTSRWQSILEGAIDGTAAGKLQNAINDIQKELQKLKTSTDDVKIDNANAENELAAFFGASIRV
nr:hypothetical protein [uncultured Mogibacterium sp.]